MDWNVFPDERNQDLEQNGKQPPPPPSPYKQKTTKNQHSNQQKQYFKCYTEEDSLIGCGEVGFVTKKARLHFKTIKVMHL